MCSSSLGIIFLEKDSWHSWRHMGFLALGHKAKATQNMQFWAGLYGNFWVKLSFFVFLGLTLILTYILCTWKKMLSANLSGVFVKTSLYKIEESFTSQEHNYNFSHKHNNETFKYINHAFLKLTNPFPIFSVWMVREGKSTEKCIHK